MSIPSPRCIRTVGPVDARVALPASKSYTNRALIVAALADGESTIVNVSKSDDTRYLISGLAAFGVQIKQRRDAVIVDGSAGNLVAPAKEVFVGNAGTAMRFLTTLAALASGETLLTGDEQMQKRPLGDLLECLRLAGIKCSGENGYPPVKIRGGNFLGGAIDLKGEVSSQFVSSILLSAPYAKHPVVLRVKGQLPSLPYIDMTMHVMRAFGASVEALDARAYTVNNRERYIGRRFQIEPDASAATYFMAAAAITHGRVFISRMPTDSLQGDVKFLNILTDMGCSFRQTSSGVEVQGAKLYGIEVDMNGLPDCVPTLAALALFAEGPTTIQNVRQLRFKETDRLSALAGEITKLGARVELFDDGLTIHPGALRGAVIETYNDHRIAMSFAVAGLRIPGVSIANPSCVSKSFPEFWDEFKKLETGE